MTEDFNTNKRYSKYMWVNDGNNSKQIIALATEGDKAFKVIHKLCNKDLII